MAYLVQDYLWVPIKKRRNAFHVLSIIAARMKVRPPIKETAEFLCQNVADCEARLEELKAKHNERAAASKLRFCTLIRAATRAHQAREEANPEWPGS